MKKWIFLAALLAIVAGIAPPLINLIVDKPVAIAPEKFSGKTGSFKHASEIFQASCLPCHSSLTELPWYANFPIAKDVIQEDIQTAYHMFNMEKELYTEGQAPSAFALAKIEHVLDEEDMPPLRYTAMHWKALLNDEKRQALRQWINNERQKINQELGVHKSLLTEPVHPIPANLLAFGEDPSLKDAPLELLQQKIDLGEKLFHDTRLSGDGSLSCASCHSLKTGGVDGTKVSKGIKGQLGPINAPTVFNAAYNVRQFWDGRAANPKQQALGPVTNPIEMGGNWETILPKLASDSDYAKAFQALYETNDTQPIEKEMVADAIATFERSLITPNSAFDQYLRGNKKALTAEQVKGYELFKSIGCTQCHAGIALGGQSFEKMGVHDDYFAKRKSPFTDVDKGRFNATKHPLDKRYFKVPTLRNIALTAPYFHDGTQATLADAVTSMAHYQLGKTLSNKDTQAIVHFLESLTGEYNGTLLQPSQPLQQKVPNHPR